MSDADEKLQERGRKFVDDVHALANGVIKECDGNYADALRILTFGSNFLLGKVLLGFETPSTREAYIKQQLDDVLSSVNEFDNHKCDESCEHEQAE